MNRIGEWNQRLRWAAVGADERLIDSSSLLGDRLRLGIASRLVIASSASVHVALPALERAPAVAPVERRIVTSDAQLLALDRFGESLQERAHAKTTPSTPATLRRVPT